MFFTIIWNEFDLSTSIFTSRNLFLYSSFYFKSFCFVLLSFFPVLSLFAAFKISLASDCQLLNIPKNLFFSSFSLFYNFFSFIFIFSLYLFFFYYFSQFMILFSEKNNFNFIVSKNIMLYLY